MMILATLQDFSGGLMHLAGFLFVVFVLSLLWMFVELIGRYFRTLDVKKVARAAAAAAAVSPVSVTSARSDELSEEELVVIASTVALMLGQRRHRLVSIRTGSGMDWSREGRRQHLQSHQINK